MQRAPTSRNKEKARALNLFSDLVDRAVQAARDKRLVGAQAEARRSFVLWSAAGGKEQYPHSDYDPDLELPGVGVLLFALQATRFVTFTSGCRRAHTLAAGDLLFFESWVVHAGAGFAEQNLRLHMYVETAGSPAPAAAVFTPQWVHERDAIRKRKPDTRTRAAKRAKVVKAD